MHHFTIRDVENLSGIKAHTLRMWEQRYGLCKCKRKESLHRYYDNDDLKSILHIAHLYHNGYKISRIAALSPEDMTQLATGRFHNNEYDVLINQLLEASMDYNQQLFETTCNRVVDAIGLEKTMEKVVYPFLNKIGLLWITGHVLPAQEHFCTYLLQQKIIAAINELPPVYTSAHRFLLFTPEGETHDLSLLFIQYVLKKKKFTTVLLGRDISIDLLKDYCAQQPVSHLYFHVITNLRRYTAQQYLQKLSKVFADKQIIASGPALKEIGTVPRNVQILHSLEEALAYEPAR